LVPTTAVLSGAPGNYVYLVEDGENAVSVHPVTLGPSDGKSTVILSGLVAGDTVVTDGPDALTDGAKVRPPAPRSAATETAQPPAGGKRAKNGGAPARDR